MSKKVSNHSSSLWKTILTREFIFEKECYKTCNSFCCRWDHNDFPRYFIPKGGTIFYLPEEYTYIQQNALLPSSSISKLSVTLDNSREVSIYYTPCNDDKNCNIKFTRTLYCRIYPFFPVFNINGELLDLKYISIYDITSELLNLHTPCYIKNKKAEYISLWKQDKELLDLFRTPYLLFHFMTADLLYDNYVDTLKQTGLLSYNIDEFWMKWERLYLKKKLIDKSRASKEISILYNNFVTKYGNDFL